MEVFEMKNKFDSLVRLFTAEMRDITGGVIEDCRRDYRLYQEHRKLMRKVNQQLDELLVHMQVYNRLWNNSMTLQRLLVSPCFEQHRHVRPISPERLNTAASCLTPPAGYQSSHFLFVRRGAEIHALESQAAALVLEQLESICDDLYKMQCGGGITDQARILIQVGMLHYQQMKRYWQQTSQCEEADLIMQICPAVPKELAVLYLEALMSNRVLEIAQETRKKAWLHEQRQPTDQPTLPDNQNGLTIHQTSSVETPSKSDDTDSFFLLKVTDPRVLEKLFA